MCSDYSSSNKSLAGNGSKQTLAISSSNFFKVFGCGFRPLWHHSQIVDGELMSRASAKFDGVKRYCFIQSINRCRGFRCVMRFNYQILSQILQNIQSAQNGNQHDDNRQAKSFQFFFFPIHKDHADNLGTSL